MGRWLDALKKRENGSERHPQNLQNLPRWGFDGFEGFGSGANTKFPSPLEDCSGEVSKVLRVPAESVFDNSPPPANPSQDSFESFEGSPSEHAEKFSTAFEWTDEDWQAAYDERAGILEYDEGLPRAEAERLAREQVFGDRPIGNVILSRRLRWRTAR